ncbi:hypothetical protein [Hymenobacter crusticola]|uniref:hypothetical protein n=1 Tax=Hymenobacter crusticola TaxID=1770526 RepID=UPI0015C4EF26|nr:hypothetical protein [Hymenobacter crusticola]
MKTEYLTLGQDENNKIDARFSWRMRLGKAFTPRLGYIEGATYAALVIFSG